MKKWLMKYATNDYVSCLLICLWVVNVQPALAEPTPSIQFLMREPVSMMDWGIKNIEDHLHSHRALFIQREKTLFEPVPTVTVVYNWEENQIQISIGLRTSEQFQKTSQGISDIRSHVEWVVKYLRGSLTMKPYDAFFRHNGFRSKDSPQNLESELMGLTELVVSVRDGESNILSRCRAPLAGSDMVWLTIGEP
jgi:hypothetical protein